MTYQRLRDIQGNPIETVLRLVDQGRIPQDAQNRDWVEYQAWLAAGNVPAPATIPPPPVVIRVSAFLARFTTAEQTALWAALSTRPQVQGALMLRLAEGSIDLTRAANLLDQMVAAGVVSEARKTEILEP